MSATTRVYTELAGVWHVESTDPATPDAHVTMGTILYPDAKTGARVEKAAYAICPHPDCDARIRLQETRPADGDGPEWTGIEYQLHYYTEHTRPAIRDEETADDPWDGIEGSDSRYGATGSTR